MAPVVSANAYPIGGDDKVLDRKEHTHLDDCS